MNIQLGASRYTEGGDQPVRGDTITGERYVSRDWMDKEFANLWPRVWHLGAVLAEFGLTLPEETAIRVWDSTAEMRYLVIPMRPEGTDGWTAEQLEPLVSRDAMIGTALAGAPS